MSERSTKAEAMFGSGFSCAQAVLTNYACLLYTSDAADDLLCVDLGGSRIIKKKKNKKNKNNKKKTHKNRITVRLNYMTQQ